MLRALSTGPDGLSDAEARQRLARHGANRLPAAKPRSPLLRFLAQFNNVLIYVLLGSAAVTALLGHLTDTAVILGVVVLNAVIGFVQEGRAESALDAIRSMLTPMASLVRGGRRLTLEAEALVPGDLVLLEAGDRVPADLRLVRARSLRVDEAVLTGESVPAEKSALPVAAEVPLGDRSSMAFSGTLVAAGQGAGVVVATGSGTELGRISTLLGTVETLTTPLVRQMNEFGRRLTAVIFVAAALILAFAVLVRSYSVADAFMAVVGIAVAAIPEGLPAVLTITLAIGVRRMAARHAIIRRLPAVETLGSVSVICSDKTGTLTRNEMTVRAAGDGGRRLRGDRHRATSRSAPSGSARRRSIPPRSRSCASSAAPLRCAATRPCGGAGTPGSSTATRWRGRSVSFAIKAGHEPAALTGELPRDDAIPFDAEHRFMATLHHDHESGSAFVCVKGAPERVVAMCDAPARRAAAWSRWTRPSGSGGSRPWRPRGSGCWRWRRGPMPAGRRELTFADVEGGLVLLGLLGLIDPPREEAMAAVRDCRAAGIAVKMITGDHAATARAIAVQLGLAEAPVVVTGAELDGVDDTALRQVAREATVFARTSPEHKLRLVQALQAEGAVVAMTGDGVNDAPALKRADIGDRHGPQGDRGGEGGRRHGPGRRQLRLDRGRGEGRPDGLRQPPEGDRLVPADQYRRGVRDHHGDPPGADPADHAGPDPVDQHGHGRDAGAGAGLRARRARFDAAPAPGREGTPGLGLRALARRAGLGPDRGRHLRHVRLGHAARAVLEEARTIAVNTIVVLEIAYLFSVRFLHLTSVTVQGVLGTPAVLITVGLVIMLQLVLTYAPFMHVLFATRPVAFLDGLAIIGVGAALLAILEIEKLVRRRLAVSSRHGPGSAMAARP